MKKRQASKFYPYFDSEEKPVIDKMTGFFNRVIFQHQPILTDFLDPRQRAILTTVSGKELLIQEDGGYPNAEKQRVFLFEDSTSKTKVNYEITPCVINYSQKFLKLTHSTILGSLANSGVKTDSFGDIITDGKGNWQIFVKTELVEFFQKEIRRIGRAQVKLEPISNDDILIPQDDSLTRSVVVASVRVDALLSSISNQSRQQIKNAIMAHLVKLNWHGIKDSNIIVKESDLISLRHFGRCQIVRIAKTRKGKYKVVVKLWLTKRNRQTN